MVWHISLIFTLFQLLFLVSNIHGVRKISSESELKSSHEIEQCQELRTKLEQYTNFFALDYFQNDRLQDEKFRYKFYVKGDYGIQILLTETDSAQNGAKCLEFGIRTRNSNPVASFLKIKFGGTETVRTEELVPVSRETPISVVIFAKNDGEVQMIVDDGPYPLLRYSPVTWEPNFISFSATAAHFYFNCRNQSVAQSSKGELGLPDEHALPVVYITFKINSISRQQNNVTVNLGYTMILLNMKERFSIAGNNSNEKLSSLDARKYQVPKLQIFSNHVAVNQVSPSYNITIDAAGNLLASADQIIQMTCQEFPPSILFCGLAFGFEDTKYHLKYYTEGQLLTESLAGFADVKVYQAPNSESISSVPLKSDIEMKFKFAKLKF